MKPRCAICNRILWDEATPFLQAPEFCVSCAMWACADAERLLTAAINTLKANRHLADGEECTLKELRDAVATIRPGWDDE